MLPCDSRRVLVDHCALDKALAPDRKRRTLLDPWIHCKLNLDIIRTQEKEPESVLEQLSKGNMLTSFSKPCTWLSHLHVHMITCQPVFCKQMPLLKIKPRIPFGVCSCVASGFKEILI